MGLPVAERWFEPRSFDHGVTGFTESHIDTMLVSNVWHVAGAERDVVIDTGNGVGPLRPQIDALADGRPVIAIATHGHFDHTGGMGEFDDRRCHDADAADVRTPYPLALIREGYAEDMEEIYAYYGYDLPDVLVSALPDEGFDLAGWRTPGAEPTSRLTDGDEIDLGDRRLQILHVPGHTPGSIALWEAATGILFTGDMLYADDRMAFDDGAAAGASLTRLRALEVSVTHPGHGRSLDAQATGALIDELLASGPVTSH